MLNFIRKITIQNIYTKFRIVKEYLRDSLYQYIHSPNRFKKQQRVLNSLTTYNFTQPPPPNKKLKVALCLSGFLRTYDKTFESYKKNIIDRYNADVFIYAPDTPGIAGSINKTIASSNDQKAVTPDQLRNTYGNDNVKDITLWTYDSTQFENLVNKHNIPHSPDGRSPARIFSAFYHIKKCNELKKAYEDKHEFKYDVVIKTRPDLGLYSPLILENLDNLSDTLYYAGGNFDQNGNRLHHLALAYPFKNSQRGEYIGAGELAFNDYINISSSQNIDKLCEAYDYLTQYNNRGLVFSPETLLAYHIVFEKKLNLSMKDFITVELFRENNPQKWNPFITNPHFTSSKY